MGQFIFRSKTASLGGVEQDLDADDSKDYVNLQVSTCREWEKLLVR